MSSTPVQIRDSVTRELIAAELIDGLTPADLDLVERQWSAERTRVRIELARANVPRSAWPQSLHWDWHRKAPELQLLSATGFAVVRGDRWEGVLMTKTSPWTSRRREARGQHLVYVDYVETAPWNWTISAIGQESELGGIGSLLIRRAVIQSVEEGFHGRMGLHALGQSEAFYTQGCQMIPLGYDENKQDLLYIELDEEGAKALLQKEDK